MNRSKRFAFVPFCLLAQGVRASGIVRKYPAVVSPVVDLLMDHKINLVQMPCPELVFDSFHRSPCGKRKYDNPRNRVICRDAASGVVKMIDMLLRNGCSVEVIMGIEGSPSCATSILYGPPPKRILNGQGIYIEELMGLLRNQRIRIPFVGVNFYDVDKTLLELQSLLRKE